MNYDVIIAGAGIVGLATGFQILKQRPGTRLLILEKENAIAQHQTGHNSGVIHSGIYYKPNSMKALNCKRGYELLIDFAEKENIAFERCGKIIVATERQEIPVLNAIYERGLANGLNGLKKINASELKDYEQHTSGLEAILVPQAGIIDYKIVAKKYAEKIETYGGEIHLNHKVKNLVNDFIKNSTGIKVITNKKSFNTKLFISATGLYADKMAALTHKKLPYQIIPFRGEYYELRKESQHLVNNLIYPVPNPNFPFLGVHFTRKIGGGIEAGPNAVLAFKREGYHKKDVDFKELWETLSWQGFHILALKYWQTGLAELYRSYSKLAFTKALQKLIPALQAKDLIEADSAGVRAQLCDNKGNLIDDFLILEEKNTINVCNAPSPAATASLAIGETVAERALKQLQS